jgi:hypothetical protein
MRQTVLSTFEAVQVRQRRRAGFLSLGNGQDGKYLCTVHGFFVFIFAVVQEKVINNM